MKQLLLFALVLCGSITLPITLRGEEAHASVYVIDHSEEYESMGGACFDYAPGLQPGPNREILAIAKGAPGSVLVVMAFEGDAIYRGLKPVVAPQTEESKAVRFPDPEGATRWTFEEEAPDVALYVAAFTESDPQLAKITEYIEWLNDSIEEKDAEASALHAHAIKNRFSEILRQQSADNFLVKFGNDTLLADSGRFAPEGKAAITRGSKPKTLLSDSGREPSAAVAAVRRGLKNLDAEWREDSRAIAFGLAKPGILVFPISTPEKP